MSVAYRKFLLKTLLFPGTIIKFADYHSFKSAKDAAEIKTVQEIMRR